MKAWYAGAITGVMLLTGSAIAGPDIADLKSIEPPDDDHPLSEIISGYEFRSAETKALQDDDFENPAMLWVDQGELLWEAMTSKTGQSCASCHGDADESMKGVKASMPKWNDDLDKPITLEEQINLCRTNNLEAEAWKWESEEMLSMTAFIGTKSRGMPMEIDLSDKMTPWLEKGKEIYYTRYGQLDLACANCHEDNYGNYIRADLLSQGQINGFPTYRLKWQGLGSLHRRFKGCIDSVRGVGFKRGSDELVALEVYLSYRGQGLPVESPAVRQ